MIPIDRADEHGDERRGRGDRQGDAEAEEDLGEDVAAGSPLDTEDVLGADAAGVTLGLAAEAADEVRVQLDRVDAQLLRDQRHDERHGIQEQEDAEAEHRDLVATQTRPDDLPEATTDHAARAYRSLASCQTP